MKLSEALPLIRTGNVALFRGRGPFAYLAKLYSRSVYSHAGLLWRMKLNGTDRVVVVESLEPFGVRVYPLDMYVGKGERIDWYAISDPAVDGEGAVKFAIKQWGLPYALKQLWASFSRLAWLIRLVFRRKLRNVDPNHWFCSELVAAAFQSVGAPTPDGLLPIDIAPGDLSRAPFLQFKGSLEKG